jgi:hypothetical protein
MTPPLTPAHHCSFAVYYGTSDGIHRDQCDRPAHKVGRFWRCYFHDPAFQKARAAKGKATRSARSSPPTHRGPDAK